MDELVSIIMPSYNTASYISNSIKSVIAQTYNNWELIIVDDCSTDNTDEIVADFLIDKRIKYYKNNYNRGAAQSRNRALQEAKGRYIAFLDSDDLWLPEKLELQLAYMKENNYAFSYTDYRICLNGKWLPYINTAPNYINKRRLYNWCYFSTITVIYDVKIVGLVQIADLKKHNDYAMWFKVIEKTNAYRFPKCLSFYIKHNDSVSSGSKFNLIKHHYILYRKALNKGKLLSVFLTVNNILHGLIKKIVYTKKLVGTDLDETLPKYY